MNFNEQRIDNLESQISALTGELDKLVGGIRPYPERVIHAAEIHFQLRDITQPTRRKRYVAARAVVITILRDEGYSLPEIGDALNRNHTTVIYSLGTIKPADFDIRAVRRLI